MNGDTEIAGDLSETNTDVAVTAEPELTPMLEPSCEGLRHEEPGHARPSCDHRSVVEQRPRIEDREHFGMGMTDHFTITVRQSREN